ncbi:hypothetical protein RJ640_000485 [Escallonia rubra]|uniref:Cytochrome P450 n=1 Tax=Escallonia rubra TaxID=112253 RepID=A0AA88U2M4_9ASTE|nr:hypothetical protein RJ640_000485 [Escallonia rubra]
MSEDEVDKDKRSCVQFNPEVDMSRPKFSVGVLKQAIREHAILTRRNIKLYTNEKERVRRNNATSGQQCATGGASTATSSQGARPTTRQSDIFSAGSETSSTTVEWAMSEMLKSPRVIKRAQAEVRKVFGERRNVDETGLRELRYLQSVIKETLRLHPSAPLLLLRESRDENGWAINRDPRYWPQAERFIHSSIDYKGTDFEFIPFGAGRRICPGITFAITNIELPLAQLLYHFDWKLPNGTKQEELDMIEAYGVTVRRKNDMCLIPVLYHPSH